FHFALRRALATAQSEPFGAAIEAPSDPKSKTNVVCEICWPSNTSKNFCCEQLFVTFVTSGFAAHIGIIPQSLVSDGQKTKTRLVPPRALHPDRNFAAWFCLPRLGSAPLTCYSVFTDVPSIPGNAAPRHKSFCASDSSSRMIHPGCHG